MKYHALFVIFEKAAKFEIVSALLSCLLVMSADNLCKKFGSRPGPEVIKLEYSLTLKIKPNDWLLADTCPQAANHCALE